MGEHIDSRPFPSRKSRFTTEEADLSSPSEIKIQICETRVGGCQITSFLKEPNRIRLRRRNRRVFFFLGVGGSWLRVGVGPYGARNGKDYHYYYFWVSVSPLPH